ncbi:hypothetical protein WI58_22245 [Burkholderia cepacia]|nr:hypothetical protein WI47_15070 [Burkholderia cepacia]KVA57202.1 hypothetical protein WI49_30260 [Burkholderia cepacia]KVA60573.1 hypothetical protein WI48_12600 [Burkholderia cepacia]KVA85050.1 hypothetical protein WI51_01075 [Burkholderia cepacia]KVA88348.1 hypothetical protein WI52_11285 [Burkholderia cepacia]
MYSENFEFALVAQIRIILQVINIFLAQHVEVATPIVRTEDSKCRAKRGVLPASNRDPLRLVIARHDPETCAVMGIAGYHPTVLYPNPATCHVRLSQE